MWLGVNTITAKTGRHRGGLDPRRPKIRFAVIRSWHDKTHITLTPSRRLAFFG